MLNYFHTSHNFIKLIDINLYSGCPNFLNWQVLKLFFHFKKITYLPEVLLREKKRWKDKPQHVTYIYKCVDIKALVVGVSSSSYLEGCKINMNSGPLRSDVEAVKTMFETDGSNFTRMSFDWNRKKKRSASVWRKD